MKIELDLPEIEGYEYTGEYRIVEAGDYCLESTNEAVFQHPNCGKTIGHYPILKKKAVKYAILKGAAFEKEYVEIKALEDAIEIIDSHYNWSADLRAATLELKSLIS
jgi:hypothetical protein